MVTNVAAHQPDRPSWQCPTCLEPFPCWPYRAHVLGLFHDPIDRSLHMGGFWQYAIIELPQPEEAGAIHRRFFGWIRESVEPQPLRRPSPSAGRGAS